MPRQSLTDEERKERRKEYMKEYREKNKERILKKREEYYQKTKEKQKQYSKEHYATNKEKQKEYYQANREKKLKQNQEYRKTENGIKSVRIVNWKRRGIICNDFDEIYEKYINTFSCDYCKEDFTEKNPRCLDHDHESGEIRGILCNRCNVRDVMKEVK